MKKNDFIRKITSRKLWLAVAEFVAMLIVFFGGSQEVATQITALIMGGAGVVAYIVAEGLTDAANAGGGAVVEAAPVEAVNENERTIGY